MGIDHKGFFFFRKKNYTCNKGVERQYAVLGFGLCSFYPSGC